MTEEESSELKVNDRRRFTAEGTLRDNEHAEKSATEKTSVEPAKPIKDSFEDSHEVRQVHSEYERSRTSDVQTNEHEQTGEIQFSSFIMSLATQALIQLGEIDPPQGMEMPQDIAGARQTIDMISMLSDKTRGNLTAEESSLLTELLHNLRMSFIRVSA